MARSSFGSEPTSWPPIENVLEHVLLGVAVTLETLETLETLDSKTLETPRH